MQGLYCKAAGVLNVHDSDVYIPSKYAILGTLKLPCNKMRTLNVIRKKRNEHRILVR